MMRSGGCQCGAARYDIDLQQVLTLYCCHCRECQRQAASAFGMSMKLPRSAFALTSGTLAQWQRPTDRGGKNRAHFCPDCGCRIYHDAGDGADAISLKAGSLDDLSGLVPVGHLWTKRAQPWVQFAPDDIVYPGQPDSYDRLIAAWRARP